MYALEFLSGRPAKAAPYYSLVLRDPYLVGSESSNTCDVYLNCDDVEAQHATLAVTRKSEFLKQQKKQSKYSDDQDMQIFQKTAADGKGKGPHALGILSDAPALNPTTTVSTSASSAAALAASASGGGGDLYEGNRQTRIMSSERPSDASFSHHTHRSSINRSHHYGMMGEELVDLTTAAQKRDHHHPSESGSAGSPAFLQAASNPYQPLNNKGLRSLNASQSGLDMLISSKLRKWEENDDGAAAAAMNSSLPSFPTLVAGDGTINLTESYRDHTHQNSQQQQPQNSQQPPSHMDAFQQDTGATTAVPTDVEPVSMITTKGKKIRLHNDAAVADSLMQLEESDPLVVVLTSLTPTGTRVNGTTASAGTQLILRDGDVIAFGAHLEMVLTYRPLVVSVARNHGFSPEYVEEMEDLFVRLGATVTGPSGPTPFLANLARPVALLHCATEVSDDPWSLLALASGYSIVRPTYIFEWFGALARHATMAINNLPPPTQFEVPVRATHFDSASYLRPESTNCPFSLYPIPAAAALNRKRDSLFEARSFFLLSVPLSNRVEFVIQMCGGETYTIDRMEEFVMLLRDRRRSYGADNEAAAAQSSSNAGGPPLWDSGIYIVVDAVIEDNVVMNGSIGCVPELVQLVEMAQSARVPLPIITERSIATSLLTNKFSPMLAFTPVLQGYPPYTPVRAVDTTAEDSAHQIPDGGDTPRNVTNGIHQANDGMGKQVRASGNNAPASGGRSAHGNNYNSKYPSVAASAPAISFPVGPYTDADPAMMAARRSVPTSPQRPRHATPPPAASSRYPPLSGSRDNSRHPSRHCRPPATRESPFRDDGHQHHDSAHALLLHPSSNPTTPTRSGGANNRFAAPTRIRSAEARSRSPKSNTRRQQTVDTAINAAINMTDLLRGSPRSGSSSVVEFQVTVDDYAQIGEPAALNGTGGSPPPAPRGRAGRDPERRERRLSVQQDELPRQGTEDNAAHNSAVAKARRRSNSASNPQLPMPPSKSQSQTPVHPTDNSRRQRSTSRRTMRSATAVGGGGSALSHGEQLAFLKQCVAALRKRENAKLDVKIVGARRSRFVSAIDVEHAHTTVNEATRYLTKLNQIRQSQQPQQQAPHEISIASNNQSAPIVVPLIPLKRMPSAQSTATIEKLETQCHELIDKALLFIHQGELFGASGGARGQNLPSPSAAAGAQHQSGQEAYDYTTPMSLVVAPSGRRVLSPRTGRWTQRGENATTPMRGTVLSPRDQRKIGATQPREFNEDDALQHQEQRIVGREQWKSKRRQFYGMYDANGRRCRTQGDARGNITSPTPSPHTSAKRSKTRGAAPMVSMRSPAAPAPAGGGGGSGLPATRVYDEDDQLYAADPKDGEEQAAERGPQSRAAVEAVADITNLVRQYLETQDDDEMKPNDEDSFGSNEVRPEEVEMDIQERVVDPNKVTMEAEEKALDIEKDQYEEEEEEKDINAGLNGAEEERGQEEEEEEKEEENQRFLLPESAADESDAQEAVNAAPQPEQPRQHNHNAGVDEILFDSEVHPPIDVTHFNNEVYEALGREKRREWERQERRRVREEEEAAAAALLIGNAQQQQQQQQQQQRRRYPHQTVHSQPLHTSHSKPPVRRNIPTGAAHNEYVTKPRAARAGEHSNGYNVNYAKDNGNIRRVSSPVANHPRRTGAGGAGGAANPVSSSSRNMHENSGAARRASPATGTPRGLRRNVTSPMANRSNATPTKRTQTPGRPVATTPTRRHSSTAIPSTLGKRRTLSSSLPSGVSGGVRNNNNNNNTNNNNNGIIVGAGGTSNMNNNYGNTRDALGVPIGGGGGGGRVMNGRRSGEDGGAAVNIPGYSLGINDPPQRVERV